MQTFGGEVRLPDLIILLHTKVGTQYSENQVSKGLWTGFYYWGGGTQYTDNDMIHIINALHFFQAIIDSAKLGIPTVGIVDSDCNPNIITYPIPGNDDTLDSTQLYLHLFKQAILLGKKKRSDDLNK